MKCPGSMGWDVNDTASAAPFMNLSVLRVVGVGARKRT